MDRPADGERQAHRDRSFAARRMRGSSQRLRRPRPGPTEEPSSPPNGYLLGPLMGPPRCPWVTRLFRIGGKHRGVGRMTSVAMVFGCQGRYWAEKSFALGLAWANAAGTCMPPCAWRALSLPHSARFGLGGIFFFSCSGHRHGKRGPLPSDLGFLHLRRAEISYLPVELRLGASKCRTGLDPGKAPPRKTRDERTVHISGTACPG